MKFTVESKILADGVAWAARSLAPRPTVAVLAGLLMTVEGDTLTITGFDLESATQIEIPISDGAAGQALVSGRLLADITRSLPAMPVVVTASGSRASLECGSAKFTLPEMPVDEYPTLPVMPTTTGSVEAADFAAAVAQVAVAAGRDSTLPMLTGIRLEIEGSTITLAATDRYRFAVRDLVWRPAESDTSLQVLVPARSLAETTKTLATAEAISISLSRGERGEGVLGLSGAIGGLRYRATVRLLDATFPAWRSLLPDEWLSQVDLDTPTLIDAVKRVALVAERLTPVRMSFGEGSVVLTAGVDEAGRAEEQLELIADGGTLVTAFNPQFLLDGLAALTAKSARMFFNSGTKPIVFRSGSDQADYTYLLMPVRLPAQ